MGLLFRSSLCVWEEIFIMRGLYTVTEWIYRFAIVNLLWILFTIAGLVIFGFFPATFAMFAVVRKWILGENEFHLLKTFYQYFKDGFVKTNLIGLIVALTGGIIYIYFQYIQATLDSALIFTHIPLYFFMIIALLTFLYLPPVFVHYDVSFFQYFKNAFIIMIMSPVYTILLAVLVVIIVYILVRIPGAVFFFGGSTLAYSIMQTCYLAFKNFEKRQAKLTQSEKNLDD